jgi:hypothetical protein
VLLVVLAIRGVLAGAGAQRQWAGRAGYLLGLAAIAIVGWLLTVVAVGIERALLARFPEDGLGDRRSRHVRTKIILVTRVVQALIVAVTVALLSALREELGRILERSSHWDRSPGDIFVEDATGPAVKLIAAVTAVDGDAIAPLCREVREGLLAFLQQNYPAALPGGQ